jgi:hypothetical protein
LIITQKYIAWIYITELKKEIKNSDQTYTLNFIDRTNLENLHLCKKKKTPWEQRRIIRDIVQISAVQTFRSIARLQYYQN